MRRPPAEQPRMPEQGGDSVVELRQYTLRPGQRDILIELFDREFIQTQEAAGMTVIGQFRDLDRDDRFVWLRAFPTMAARSRSLAAFYGGPTWARHRDAANATMINSSDVLLLRPAGPSHGFARPVRGAPSPLAQRPGVVMAGIATLAGPLDPVCADCLAEDVSALVRDAGGTPVACLVSEHSPNTFPQLPVRENDDVFVWIATAPEELAGRPFLVESSGMGASLAGEDAVLLGYESLRLAPTERSALRG